MIAPREKIGREQSTNRRRVSSDLSFVGIILRRISSLISVTNHLPDPNFAHAAGGREGKERERERHTLDIRYLRIARHNTGFAKRRPTAGRFRAPTFGLTSLTLFGNPLREQRRSRFTTSRPAGGRKEGEGRGGALGQVRYVAFTLRRGRGGVAAARRRRGGPAKRARDGRREREGEGDPFTAGFERALLESMRLMPSGDPGGAYVTTTTV